MVQGRSTPAVDLSCSRASIDRENSTKGVEKIKSFFVASIVSSDRGEPQTLFNRNRPRPRPRILLVGWPRFGGQVLS